VLLYVITYDVRTCDVNGPRRLRQVAKVCEAKGRRVQKSVFECRLTDAQLEALLKKLRGIMDPSADSLRVYRIPPQSEELIEVYGLDHAIDFTDTLIF
jgi:CRISPR-associated protein Cas2